MDCGFLNDDSIDQHNGLLVSDCGSYARHKARHDFAGGFGCGDRDAVYTALHLAEDIRDYRCLALYFNVFVLVVQSFEKVSALRALAPTQKEPPFAIAQILVLAIFVVVTAFYEGVEPGIKCSCGPQTKTTSWVVGNPDILNFSSACDDRRLRDHFRLKAHRKSWFTRGLLTRR